MDTEPLLTALRASVLESLGGQKRAAVSFSGGLDSSVIAALAQGWADIRCYTCGVEGSFDAENVASLAALEGRAVTTILLRPDDVRKLAGRTARLVGTRDPTRIAYTAPTVCVLEHASERLVLAGNGADELFGGYAKYADASDAEGMMAADIVKAVNESEILKMVSGRLGKDLRFPFLSERIMILASNIPLDQKVSGKRRKIILRRAAGALGLASADRPKKAAQYSSGILKCMKMLSRDQGVGLAEWTAGL